MTRIVKTAEARALEQVAILRRRLDKIRKTQAGLELQAHLMDPELAAIQKRLDYALANPDLPPKKTPVAEPEATTPNRVGTSP